VKKEWMLTLAACLTCLGLTGMSVVPKLSLNHIEIKQTQTDITIAISGEVLNPGTYLLPWGASLEEAVVAAGGFTDEADKNLVNLAAPLDAGEAIFVPGHMSETGLERISINSAPASQLESLPRIGPKMAHRIIENRPFNTLDDLLKVKGIGNKTLEGLRGFVTL
jgi:competence protein ComEA